MFIVDDTELYKATIIGDQHNEPTLVEFDIPAHAQELTLVVTDAGDGGGCDHWTLGNARLFPRNLKEIPIDRTTDPTTPQPQKNIPQTFLGKDGTVMVLIPAGDFVMGTPADTGGNSRTSPAHTVYLDSFYIDVHEVTVGHYNQFVQATGYQPLPDWVSEYSPTDQHPVVLVSWHDARAYAKWAGKRLPTEAEWEKAARGGLVSKTHPWGDDELDGTQCNFADKSLHIVWKKELFGDNNWADKNIDDGYTYTSPVGSFPPNGYGLFDMAGNVWEWCFDAYDENFYANSPRRNPIASIIIKDTENNITAVNNKRSLRGVSWLDRHVWIASRLGYPATGTTIQYGFRCAKSVVP